MTLTTFEKITKEFTDDEMIFYYQVLMFFQTKIAKEVNYDTNFICRKINEQLLKLYIGEGPVNKIRQITPIKLRKAIHMIRVKGQIKYIVGTSKGYMLTTDKNKVDLQIKSLQQRINSIQEVINSFKH